MSTKISRRKVLLGAGPAGAATMLLDGTGAASLMTVRAQEPQIESEVPESSLDLLKNTKTTPLCWKQVTWWFTSIGAMAPYQASRERAIHSQPIKSETS